MLRKLDLLFKRTINDNWSMITIIRVMKRISIRELNIKDNSS